MTVFRFRNWLCNDCGQKFRSMETNPVCPHCTEEPSAQVAGLSGSDVSIDYIPPQRSELDVATATLSDRTKNNDGIARALMKEYGMTDMRDNQKEGDISAPPLTHAQQKIAQQGFWHGVDPSAVGRSVGATDGYSGVGKGDAMKAMQNLAKKAEGF